MRVDRDVGNDFDLTVSGDADAVTITNDEEFAVDVYVKAGAAPAGGGVFGPFTVPADGEATLTFTDTGGKGLGTIGVVCEGSGTPEFPPFTRPSSAGKGDDPGAR